MPVATSRQNSGGRDRDLDEPPLPRSTRGRRAGPTTESDFMTNNVGIQSQQKQTDISLNILFNQSKDEPYTLSSGYNKFQRELKAWKIAVNRDEITLERLLQARLFVSVSPSRKFSASELDAMKRYVTAPHSGSILILMSEGGESKMNTNINVLLDEFGIQVKLYFIL
jgi:hypothetical protein